MRLYLKKQTLVSLLMTFLVGNLLGSLKKEEIQILEDLRILTLTE